MQEMQVRSLGQEDPLEKKMATHSSILGLGNPMNRGAWKATVQGGCKKSDMTYLLNNNNNIFFFSSTQCFYFYSTISKQQN